VAYGTHDGNRAFRIAPYRRSTRLVLELKTRGWQSPHGLHRYRDNNLTLFDFNLEGTASIASFPAQRTAKVTYTFFYAMALIRRWVEVAHPICLHKALQQPRQLWVDTVSRCMHWARTVLGSQPLHKPFMAAQSKLAHVRSWARSTGVPKVWNQCWR
jgi:hypothetical protein